jgi:hypothetical protein
MTTPSRSRVDRAGKQLRDHQLGDLRLTEEDLSAELAIVEAFRAVHAEPMSVVAADLRRLALAVSNQEPEVGQRLKRS